MSTIQIIIAALSVAKEFIAYLKAKEENKKERAKKAKTFAAQLKEARKRGSTKDLERVFGDAVNGSGSD